MIDAAHYIQTLQRALDVHGYKAQLRKAAEEHLELAHALLRLIEGAELGLDADEMNKRMSATVEEYADSEIMRTQLIKMGAVDQGLVTLVMAEKIDRLAYRLNNQKPGAWPWRLEGEFLRSGRRCHMCNGEDAPFHVCMINGVYT